MREKHRHSTRWRGYDYTAQGAYFVTVCAYRHARLFGAVVEGAMQLNAWGELVRDCWLATPEHFPRVVLDAFVVMPNHMHGILFITAPDVRAQPVATGRGVTPNNVTSGSLGAIVRSFKAAVTRQGRLRHDGLEHPVWQRNYHDRVLRNDGEYQRARFYTLNNPQRWHRDRHNTDNPNFRPD